MTSFSPRIAPPLVALAERLADGDLAAAEIRRRVGDEADRRGLARPSYESVREIVRRRRDEPRRSSAGEVAASTGW